MNSQSWSQTSKKKKCFRSTSSFFLAAQAQIVSWEKYCSSQWEQDFHSPSGTWAQSPDPEKLWPFLVGCIGKSERKKKSKHSGREKVMSGVEELSSLIQIALTESHALWPLGVLRKSLQRHPKYSLKMCTFLWSKDTIALKTGLKGDFWSKDSHRK